MRKNNTKAIELLNRFLALSGQRWCGYLNEARPIEEFVKRRTGIRSYSTVGQKQYLQDRKKATMVSTYSI